MAELAGKGKAMSQDLVWEMGEEGKSENLVISGGRISRHDCGTGSRKYVAA